MEKLQKNTENFYKNRVNPAGTGIIRLKLWEMLKVATRPMTIKNIQEKFAAEGTVVTWYLAARIIGEYQQVQPEGYEIISIQVRAGKSRAAAFIINKSKKVLV